MKVPDRANVHMRLKVVTVSSKLVWSEEAKHARVLY